MAERYRAVFRGEMTAAERETRSRITQLIQKAGLIRGTLLVRQRKCGKASCHCASGDGHVSLHLQVSRRGKPVQVIVPRKIKDEVREWVANYGKLWDSVEALSDVYWAKIAADKAARRKR